MLVWWPRNSLRDVIVIATKLAIAGATRKLTLFVFPLGTVS